jgi:hypothetical protein
MCRGKQSKQTRTLAGPTDADITSPPAKHNEQRSARLKRHGLGCGTVDGFASADLGEEAPAACLSSLLLRPAKT